MGACHPPVSEVPVAGVVYGSLPFPTWNPLAEMPLSDTLNLEEIFGYSWHGIMFRPA